MTSKSIRIYLADGSSTGLRHAEIVNWTGQGLAIPRNRIGELKDWIEVLRPGIYFLFGEGKISEKPYVYIGESENVQKRLAEQVKAKDFWNIAIAFTSKDENLTKSHIRYLESRAIEDAIEGGRYEVENANSTKRPVLPRSDRDSMEEFFKNVKVLLGTLGHRVLEPLIKTIHNNNESELSEISDKFVFETRKFVAYGVQSDEGFVLLKDSKIAAKHTKSLIGTLVDLRKQAVIDGRLKKINNELIVAKNMLFGSSSYAAGFVAGYSRNGRTSWKTVDGLTLKEVEEAAISN